MLQISCGIETYLKENRICLHVRRPAGVRVPGAGTHSKDVGVGVRGSGESLEYVYTTYQGGNAAKCTSDCIAPYGRVVVHIDITLDVRVVWKWHRYF